MHQKHIEGGVANAHWYWVVELGRTCGVTGLSMCRDETVNSVFLEPISRRDWLIQPCHNQCSSLSMI